MKTTVKMTVDQARTHMMRVLDNLPPDALVLIERDQIEIEPADGWRRFKPGNTITLTIETPQEQAA